MLPHKIVSPEEWRIARIALLAREKEHTRQRDALDAERRALPWVRIAKDYRFEGPQGPARLIDLFEGRRQLIIYHFMLGPDWTEGCPGCSLLVDNFGHPAHLNARDTTRAAVSRAPLGKILPFKARMGWSFPWYSSFGSDFNYDFHVTLDEAVAPSEYNYRDKAGHEQRGMPWFTQGEVHGLSVFITEGGSIFHTYSTYARGLDQLGNTYSYLDLTPLGRQEGWGGTAAMTADGKFWVRHHDRYEPRPAAEAAPCCAAAKAPSG